jgi:putative alpha-1,2-mannosidase
VRRASLNLPNGKRFTVIADGFDDAHPYVGSVTLEGKPLARTFITHQELMAGGELRFAMQATPNRDWPGKSAKAPYSMSGL